MGLLNGGNCKQNKDEFNQNLNFPVKKLENAFSEFPQIVGANLRMYMKRYPGEQVLPDRRRCCSKVLHGIEPSSPPRKIPFSMRVERAAKFRKRSPRTVINWDHFVSVWEDSVIKNIDEDYYRLVEHLHDSGTKAESLEVTKGRLSPETLELIRQRGAARAAGNHQLTSELAKQCREAIKEDLKERRAALLAEAAEAGRSIRNACRSFASYKTKMTCLRRPDGTVTASRRAVEKVIHNFYSDLFDSHVHLPTYQLQQDGYVVPSVLSSEFRHAIKSVKNRTAPGLDRVTSKHIPTHQNAEVSNDPDDFTREELLKLLSYFEGELQARDEVVARLRNERTKFLLFDAKYGKLGGNDPMCALRRDSAVTEEELDEHQIGQLYESQLVQLEKLIAVQRRSHLRAKSLLAAAEKRHFKALRELELEKERKSRYAAQGDDVLALLEREREKLCQQAENLSLKEVVKGQEADLLMLRKNLISSTKLTFDKPATRNNSALDPNLIVMPARAQKDPEI
ncbi:hypothetical protein TELCIR_08190 [Teladorsagia circumcincta]|uniref:Cortactin-binding protein-2 N-terminal domain-containing protein n=1 Tax=Teladorsagia circumcincta TaxID=45464 RepID=A0A2G9UKE7_TELCI|nr:hypothetical protein TELCIR_08190 [Teladorsagia circumcincta]